MFTVFRVERVDNKIGPYQGNQQALDFINDVPPYMEDLDDIEVVKNLCKTGKARFGYNNLESILKAIRSIRKLNALGFFLTEYNVSSIAYHNISDNQVVFDVDNVISSQHLLM